MKIKKKGNRICKDLNNQSHTYQKANIEEDQKEQDDDFGIIKVD